MLLDEKLGLNPMQSKANKVLNSENMMVFLLIMKKKKIRSPFYFMFYLDDWEFCTEKLTKLLTLIFT